MNPELNHLAYHLADYRGFVVRNTDDGVLLAEEIDGDQAFVIHEIDDVDEWLDRRDDS